MNYGFMTKAEWKNFGYESPILYNGKILRSNKAYPDFLMKRHYVYVLCRATALLPLLWHKTSARKLAREKSILHMCRIDFSRASLRALVLCHNKESRAVVLCIVHTHSDTSLENSGKLGYYERFFPLYRIMDYGFMTNAEWKNLGYSSPILTTRAYAPLRSATALVV